MTRRLVLLTLCFVAVWVYTTVAMRPEQVPLRRSLSLMPLPIGRWTGRPAARFSQEVEAVLGADEYLTRYYLAPAEPPVDLYIGYYQSQREGDTIHSPMNCLPGAGWAPVSSGRLAIAIEGREAPIVVNRYVIQKGVDRQLVLYWYQSQGRVVASEYWSKAYLVYDALRSNRSDAALVRVISPVLPAEGDSTAAEGRAVAFVQALFPRLEHYLPS